MKKKLPNTAGFTLLELMVTLAVLAVSAYLAAPSIVAMYAKTEIKSAQQDVVQALRKAKQYAKSLNTSVTVTFTQNATDNKISFVFPNGSNQLPDGTRMSDIVLPGQVTVSGANASYKFNSLGIVDNTGAIKLTSSRDSNKFKTVTVLNLIGQLQVD